MNTRSAKLPFGRSAREAMASAAASSPRALYRDPHRKRLSAFLAMPIGKDQRSLTSRRLRSQQPCVTGATDRFTHQSVRIGFHGNLPALSLSPEWSISR